MNLRRTLTAAGAALLALTAAAAPAVAAPAPTTAPPSGTASLASVLAADGDTFDRNWYDFDIVDQAVAAVLAAKPDSPVAVLADGTVPLAAFLPTAPAGARHAPRRVRVRRVERRGDVPGDVVVHPTAREAAHPTDAAEETR